MPKRRTRIILALVLFFLIFLPLFTNGVDLLVDWLWFKQEGFRIVYRTILTTQIALSGMVGMGFILLTGLNLLIARALAHRQGYRVYSDYIELPALDRFGVAFRWLVWVGVLLIGYFVGQWGMSHWLDYLMAKHARTIGQQDPLFGIDLGFYNLPPAFQLVSLSPCVGRGDCVSAERRIPISCGRWRLGNAPGTQSNGSGSRPPDGAGGVALCGFRLSGPAGHVRAALLAARHRLWRRLRRRARYSAHPAGGALPLPADRRCLPGGSEVGAGSAAALFRGSSGCRGRVRRFDLSGGRTALHCGPQ